MHFKENLIELVGNFRKIAEKIAAVILASMFLLPFLLQIFFRYVVGWSVGWTIEYACLALDNYVWLCICHKIIKLDILYAYIQLNFKDY